MTNKERIERWLDRQIKLKKRYNDASEVKINKFLTLQTCGTQNYVHLYRCMQKIADILELPVKSEIFDLPSGKKVLQLSFMYHGFEFIQIGEDNEEYSL